MNGIVEVAARLGGTLVAQSPLTGGVSARVTALDLTTPSGPRRVVLREPGAAAWKGAGPDAAQREYRLLQALHQAGLPVAEPLVLTADACGYAMAFVPGTTELPPDGPAAMARLLARIHAVTAPVVLPDREDPIAGLAALIGRGLRVALSPRRTLLHGDFWPGNVLWHEGQVAAVLDWEDAALGDPLSDVACCRLELRYLLGARGTTAFTAVYAEDRSLPMVELAVWDAYVAAAALASMAQWGLPPAKEAHMRQQAEASLMEALEVLES